MKHWELGTHPETVIVDVDAQMKRKTETGAGKHYKSESPEKSKTPNETPPHQHWPRNEFLGNGC
jgi:hypothetical protein